MKKIFLLLLIAVALGSSDGFAQDGRERFRAMMKDRLKEELKLDDAVADSVVTVQMNFGMKMRDMRTSTDLNDEQKAARAKELTEERKKALKKFLNDEQLKKLEDYEERQRQMRQQRGGGN